MNGSGPNEVEVVTERPFSAKVEALAGFGIPAADIAIVTGTDEASLLSDYADEVASGQIKANARVAESLYRKAIGEGRESVTAAIFWLKTRARWKEASIHEIAARDLAGAKTHDNRDVANALMLALTQADQALL